MLLPHLKIESNLVPKYVLMPSDPGKVETIGQDLLDFKILNQNREYRTGIGTWNGIPVMVCSTGIGCPSTAIATEELIDAGAAVLIRVGTCGGAWQKNIPNGSFIVPTSTIRDEGTTLEYIPQGFPAVADFEVVAALAEAGKGGQNKIVTGINRTHDAFYGSLASITKWGQYLLDDKWKNYDSPILSSEMECAAIFVIASLKGAKAGAILLANADPELLRDRIYGQNQKVVTESSEEETRSNMKKMIKVVLASIELMA